MKLLTTNSAGNDIFGGIHTRKTEQVKNSPTTKFHIVELNSEKSYVSRANCTVHRLDTAACTEGRGLFGILNTAQTFPEFDQGVERLVNEFQNIIRDERPDVILIPGTSLTSYLLFKAARREQVLHRTMQEYAGVLEKEIGNYSGNQRYILEQVGKVFVSPVARNHVTYLFPSEVCKKVVEEIHNVQLERAHIVWNGVSEEFFPVHPSRKAPNELTLGYIGRVHHVKNLPFFLNLNSGREYPARLKIITDLASAMGKTTSKILVRKLTDGEVYYYAPRPKTELAQFYATELSASVVSSFFETYCNGAVESLVCGTPCLLSDRAGATEVFEHYGMRDLIYSTDDMSSFNRSLEAARNMDFKVDEDVSKRMSEDLSWKKVIGKYQKIAEEVVANPR
ncbi:MAG: glycosyltransferase family 4 protein [archaeon]